MLFHVLYLACCTSIGLQTKISWRLLKQGKELTFINLLLAIQFLINLININIYLHFFFQISSTRFFPDHEKNEDVTFTCNYYINSSLGLYITGSLPSFGIVFCRFIYVRYAHGLLADKGRLFHKIVLLAIFVFTLHGLLIWPLLYHNDYKEIIQGRVCNKLEFPDASEVEFHVKPKLLSCMGVGLYMMACTFFHWSARRQRAKHGIPRRRWNLLTFNQHAMYLHLIGVCHLVDQLIINIYIQVFHSTLGVEVVFKIWCLWHLSKFILIHIIAPYLIIRIANKEYPEFEGLLGKKFPGQEKPRSQPIIPMRETVIFQDASFDSIRRDRLRRHQGLKKKTKMYQALPQISEEVVHPVVVDIH